MTTNIELRQNRNLINSNFQGYKLSLDPIAIIKKDLLVKPLKSKPSDEQYSYLHAELFSLHNFLKQNQWNRNDSYFINESGEIIKCSYNTDIGKPNELCTVYKLQNVLKRQSRDYPVEFKFLSENLCILCNGINEIILLDTNNRTENNEWTEIFKYEFEMYQRIMIKDSRLNYVNDKKFISCIIQHIKSNEICDHTDDNEQSGHVNELINCIFNWNEENNKWEFIIKNILFGKGNLNYCAFDHNGESLILSSNKEYGFKNDENNLKNDVNSQENEKTIKGLGFEENNLNKEKSLSYLWSQTENDITIKFNKELIKNDENCKVISTKQNLTIWSSGVVVFEGNLFEKIDSDVTTWTWTNDYFELILIKEQENLNWPYLIKGGPAETIEDRKQEEISNEMNRQPVADLQSEIEECDFPSNSIDEEYKIVRIDMNTLKTTHKICLGKSPILFYTYLQVNDPPAIVIRQDVDATVWCIKSMLRRQETDVTSSSITTASSANNVNEWYLHHEGNLHAFAYVQASKQQKKFINCSPNLQYAIICESYRHVFIYKLDNDNELRNRSNGPSRITIGRQYVVTLDDANNEILGLTVTNTFATLLTEKSVLYLQIN